MIAGSAKIFRFGDFQLDAARRILLHGNAPVVLNAKAFDLLTYLVRNHGRVVSKDEILNDVWNEQMVEEGNLSVQVSHLRKALGDNPSEPIFIATIPGKGYQFVGIVERSSGDDVAPQTDRKKIGRWAYVLLALAVLILVSFGLWSLLRPEVNRSIAVLPFANETGEPELDYLSDGIAESVLYSLSKLQDLKVLSRDSSFRFRGVAGDHRSIGRELGVTSLLTGRVSRAPDAIYVSAELISADDGRVIWGAGFLRPAADVEKLQNDITLAIARRLELRIGEGGSADPQAGTEDLEAYQLYLTGRHHLGRLTDDGFRAALEAFRSALAKDPNYALAHNGLAESYNYLAGWGAIAANDGFPLAKAAALRAIELDPSLSEAHTSLGIVRLFYDLDFPGAESSFDEAVRLNPNQAEAHHMRGYSLMLLGDHSEARDSITRSRELDPLSILKIVTMGNSFFFERRYEEAIAEYLRALSLEANSGLARWSLGNAFLHSGQRDAAIEELSKAVELSGDSPDEPASLAVAYAKLGRMDDARKILTNLEQRSRRSNVPKSLLAIVNAELGNRDKAFELLETGLRERDPLVPFLKVDPFFDPLRDDLRFTQLLVRAGLQ